MGATPPVATDSTGPVGVAAEPSVGTQAAMAPEGPSPTGNVFNINIRHVHMAPTPGEQDSNNYVMNHIHIASVQF